jgi:anti-sigma B factor antagonist
MLRAEAPETLQEARVEIDEQQANGQARVMRPEGRLDMASAPSFRHQVRQLMDVGAAKLVLDLSDVSFIDSSGLGAIISGLKLARQAGGDLRIACANQQVKVVLELTSLNQVLRPYPSVEEALTDF